MLQVIVSQYTNLESALYHFNQQLRNEGVIDEMRARMYYQKPSKIRYRKKQVSLYKQGGDK